MSNQFNRPAPLVTLRIPANLVTKSATTSDEMRWILDNAYRVSLGRCDWSCLVVITGTVEQFGFFSYLLKEKGIADLLTKIEVEMFIPEPVLHPPVIFDATVNKPKPLALPKKPSPSPSHIAVS